MYFDILQENSVFGILTKVMKSQARIYTINFKHLLVWGALGCV